MAVQDPRHGNPVCKGDWLLGTACGICERCIKSAPGAIARLRLELREEGRQKAKQTQLVKDLSMLVRRLIRRARGYDEKDAVAAQSETFLQKNELLGSPLRAGGYSEEQEGSGGII